jgi:UPF0755 protein
VRRARFVRTVRVGILALLGGVLAMGAAWIAYPGLRGPGPGRAVEVVIPRGAGPSTVGRIVEGAGLVRSGRLFALYVRLAGATPRLRYGRHRLHDDETPRQVLMHISRAAPGAVVRLTIPEGQDLFDVARTLDEVGVVPAGAFLAAAHDRALLDEMSIPGPSVEGYLYPDTYEVRAGLGASGASRLLARMVANFSRRTAKLLGSLRPLARQEVVVLASIVEREAQSAGERGRIAAVFKNRLAAPDFTPHVLQADPTVSYGCRVDPARLACAGFTGRLGRRQLQDAENPYNTYLREGLPPGPICNPGLPSLRAALHPAPSEDLYFVARGDGTHAFAKTLQEHNRNVARYRR